jgi:hypothetical protein
MRTDLVAQMERFGDRAGLDLLAASADAEQAAPGEGEAGGGR